MAPAFNVKPADRYARPQNAGGAHGAGPRSCVAEEWHILPLAESDGFFAVFRTSQVRSTGLAQTARLGPVFSLRILSQWPATSH